MQNIVTFVIATSLATQSYATDLSGVYAGGYIGRALGINKMKSTTALRRDGISGFEEGATLKVQNEVDKTVLGLEGSFLFSNIKGRRFHKFFQLQFGETIRKKYGGDVCLNIGRRIDSSLIYIKTGICYSKFEFISARYNHTKNVKSVIVGAGFETPITKDWYWGGEYKQTFSEKINFQVKDDQISCKLIFSQFGLKLNYKL